MDEDEKDEEEDEEKEEEEEAQNGPFLESLKCHQLQPSYLQCVCPPAPPNHPAPLCCSFTPFNWLPSPRWPPAAPPSHPLH